MGSWQVAFHCAERGTNRLGPNNLSARARDKREREEAPPCVSSRLGETISFTGLFADPVGVYVSSYMRVVSLFYLSSFAGLRRAYYKGESESPSATIHRSAVV